MRVGRREGVDEDGFIVSGAAVELIPAQYQPVLESCVSTLVSSVDGLIAVYLYGSVATGRASVPQSDIDLLVVTADRGSSESVEHAARELTRRHRLVARDVGVAEATMAGLRAEGVDALGVRCFIKHYCVLLHGDDVRVHLPSYRPSATMAWAFNHNITTAIEDARRRLAERNDPTEVRVVCRVIARKVMFAAASLVSVITSSWTTDRRHAADVIGEHYPEWAEQAKLALGWGAEPTDDPSRVRELLDGFATWIARELEDKAAPSGSAR